MQRVARSAFRVEAFRVEALSRSMTAFEALPADEQLKIEEFLNSLRGVSGSVLQ